MQEVVHAIQSDLGYVECHMSNVSLYKIAEDAIPDIYPGMRLIMMCIRVVNVSKTAIR